MKYMVLDKELNWKDNGSSRLAEIFLTRLILPIQNQC